MYDIVQLCNRCVREFLIPTRIWFAFFLPSKTGLDNALVRFLQDNEDIPQTVRREVSQDLVPHEWDLRIVNAWPERVPTQVLCSISNRIYVKIIAVIHAAVVLPCWCNRKKKSYTLMRTKYKNMPICCPLELYSLFSAGTSKLLNAHATCMHAECAERVRDNTSMQANSSCARSRHLVTT
jgi:hypothetical protein